MSEWWQSFFDDDYLHLWGADNQARTAAEVDGIWKLLGLQAGSRVLDAPCGYGRISQPLAARGAIVLGVDQSQPLVAHAERNRDGVGSDRLKYRVHDLRAPLDDGGFDAALNVFSSLGYGSEDDDLAVLTTLRRAVHAGGRVFIDTNHRDVMATFFARGQKPSQRHPDGTLFVEEPRFDTIAGRVETTWYWSGPRGHGQKSGSIRIYSITELVALMKRAGLALVSAHKGCSPEPFVPEGPSLGGRVGLVAKPM
ncbi:MAG TPA: methyltransferase domain-containing protein [Polyangia bacterium]|jgi:SAM-dependent methyltransferase